MGQPTAFESRPQIAPPERDAAGPGSRRAADTSRPASRFVEGETARLHYLVATPARMNSPVLLLIHGTGSNAASWHYQLNGLREVARPLAVDLPGHGLSGRIGPPSVPAYAEAIAEMLPHLHPGRIFVAGHSLGGAVALELALRYPERVRGLVLLSTGAHFPALAATPDLFLLPVAAAPGKFRDLFLGEGVSAEALALARAAMAGCPPEVIRADVSAAKVFDARATLPSLRLPVLILCGTEDHITPPRYATWLKEGLPDARVILIPGAGHMLPLERPAEVNAAITEFLRREGLLARILRRARRVSLTLLRRCLTR